MNEDLDFFSDLQICTVTPDTHYGLTLQRNSAERDFSVKVCACIDRKKKGGTLLTDPLYVNTRWPMTHLPADRYKHFCGDSRGTPRNLFTGLIPDQAALFFNAALYWTRIINGRCLSRSFNETLPVNAIESRNLSLIFNPANTRLKRSLSPYNVLSRNDTFFIIFSLYVSERMIRDYLIATVGNPYWRYIGITKR